MTASLRAPSTRPWPSSPPPSRPASPTTIATIAGGRSEVTVSITVRGDDALAAVAPLVAAFRSLGSAQVTVHLAAAAEPVVDAASGDTAPLHICAREYLAVLDGTPLTLTRREFDLLNYLATNPRRVFTRGQLLQAVWGYEFSGGGRTVDVHVRRLRQKLGSRGPAIATVRGVGYRLDDADRVRLVDPPEQS